MVQLHKHATYSKIEKNRPLIVGIIKRKIIPTLSNRVCNLMIIGKEDSATFIASASALSASNLSVGLSSCESFVKGIKQTLDMYLKIESYYLLIRINAVQSTKLRQKITVY